MGDTIENAKLQVEATAKGFPEAQAAVQRLESETYDLADADELAAKAAAREAEMRARVAEASKLAARDVYELTTIEKVQAQAAREAAEAARAQAAALTATSSATAATSVVATKAATAVHQYEASARASTGSTRNLGLVALEGSRALEDMQYGFAGVINQVPGVVLGLGGSMGVAAAISVVTVGAYQLYKHWDDLTNLWQEKRPFPTTTGDLVGLNDELEHTKKELEDLRKIGSLNPTQFSRAEELQAMERDLKDQIEVQTKMEALRKAKSESESAVIDALEKSLKESGQKLEDLAPFVANRKEMITKGYGSVGELVQAILKGDQQAYDLLIKGLGKDRIGRESSLFNLLKRYNPDPEEVAKREFNEFWQDRQMEVIQEAKDLNKQAIEGESEMFRELADQARKGITEGLASRLKDVLIRTRAEGSKGKKELEYLQQRIADEMARLFPELAKFPALAASVAAELARKIRLQVDDAIQQMQQQEGLTKAQALRRLNQQRAEKGQEKQEALAADEFKQFAAGEAARQARLNPGAPPATPESIAARAKQLQDQLREAGVGPQGQIAIGQILNNPQARGLVGPAMQAMQARGFDEAGALRALPQFFQVLKGGQAGIERAADKMEMAAEHQERAAFNRAALQAGAVPRRPAPERRAVERPAAPAAGKPAARPVPPEIEEERRRRGFRSVAPDEPGPGPGVAALAQPIARGQGAIDQTMAAVERDRAIIARLNARVAQLEQRARGLTNHTVAMGPSALNSGGSTA